MSTESVKVAVRVRPFNGREKDRNATCIIRMDGPKTTIINPDTQEEKDFQFDYSYWSHDGFDMLQTPEDGYPGDGYNAPANRKGGPSTSEFGCEYASQKFVYDGLGNGVLNNALDGYNCCLFAYGQTGSGKSYSFVGYGSNKGIVPQVCDAVFKKKTELEADGKTSLQVTFSMMEIYNEKIRDLLNPDPKTNNDLKVRTTPKGTYVEGAKAKAVGSYKIISDTMDAGTASRTVAATQMNATSSRAHTIMTISVKQIVDEGGGRKSEKMSDMNLVDLAGSERAESTGATGDRLKEGAAINKSLSSLGNVISALADQANNPKKKVFIPYRDSKLTQILQSALGGNSKTIMVAALSPADINFEETLSTLRYADRAKQIKVVVEVQENPTDKLIRQLKEENDKLKKMMESMGDGFDPAALMAAQAGGGGDEASKGTITEEEMEAAIQKAVDEVKGSAAADKAAAIEAVRREMLARNDGLAKNMIARADMDQTLRDTVEACGSPADKKSAAIASEIKVLDSQSATRAAAGEDDLFGVEDVKKHVMAALKAAGCDDAAVAKGVGAAEMRFDQLLRDAADGFVDAGVLKANLARANQKLGKNSVDEKAAMSDAGFGAGSGAASGAAEQRAKLQIAQALMQNQQMMADLSESFDDKLSKSDAESEALLKSLGLGGLTPDEMKVTPSLRNLNQDAQMSDALVYYLQGGDTSITTNQDEDLSPQAIVLGGGGMVARHGVVQYNKGGATPLVYIKGNGAAFINGKILESESAPLKHNDRLILGNAEAFRVVDPNDPNASSNKQLIDWDLAQTELAEALGTAVDLKVEEEVAKKKAELDAQLKAMEEKFARENAQLKAALTKGGGGTGAYSSASSESLTKQMEERGRSIEAYKVRVNIHLNEYKRELFRLEEALKKLMPSISEANVLAQQLGRGIKYESTIVTTIPQSMTLSPVEELLTQKKTELQVRCVLANPRTDEKRDWLWPKEHFFDRVAHMRNTWQDWMLKSVDGSRHDEHDPFWSAPRSQHVGDAYVYLAPVAYGIEYSAWVPILNYRGDNLGEIKVRLVPKTTPTADPFSLVKKDVAFTLIVEKARGLLSCPNKEVYIEYYFGGEDFSRKTPIGTGKKFEPNFNYTDELSMTITGENEVAYLCKDAVCLSVFGKTDDVQEADNVAVEMEVPPEVFDASVAYDVRPAHAELAKEGGGLSVAYDAGCKAHVVAASAPHLLLLGVGQESRNFKICDMGSAKIGNVRPKGGKATDTAWTSLPVVKQLRGHELEMQPWLVEVQMNELPKACVAGGTYEADLQIEIQEIERIGELEEPIKITKAITLKVVDTEDHAVLTQNEMAKRLAMVTTTHECYLGKFEVSDDAVNTMMQKLREQASKEGSDAKTVLNEQGSQIEKLKQGLQTEMAAQYEALGLQAQMKKLELNEALGLWQLPTELLGGGAAPSDDPEELKRQLADKGKQLAATLTELDRAKNRIAQLEGELAEAKKAPAVAPTSAATSSKAAVDVTDKPKSKAETPTKTPEPVAEASTKPAPPAAPPAEEAKSSACAVM